MSNVIRILSLSREEHAEKPRTMQDNLEYYKTKIYKHSAFRPSFIVMPEHCPTIGVPKTSPDFIQQPDGPAFAFFSKIARGLRTHIVMPVYLADNKRPGNRFNSALVIDDAGKCIGRYDKIYPTQLEYSGGVTPGALDQKVVETKHGKIGVAICFDSNFPEIWQSYGRQEARIVFWPSAWHGGMKLNGYAAAYYYHIVTATYTRCMRHINPMGFDVAEAKGQHAVIETELDLDEVYTSNDYSNLKVNAIRAKYGDRVKIEEFMHSDGCRIVSMDPKAPTMSILKEYGLKDYRAYLGDAKADADLERITGKGPRYTEPAW